MTSLQWDPEVQRALECMTIYQRERLRERLIAMAGNEGLTRIDAAALARSRAAGGMAGGAPATPLAPTAWPVLPGSYLVPDAAAPVAVCTLASETLPEQLGTVDGVAIVGRAFTENLGVEKVAINIVANPAIRVLLLCGTESRHYVGQTLLALAEHGLDSERRVVGSRGPLPLLRNLAPPGETIFREKLRIIDLIGENDAEVVGAAIRAACSAAEGPWPAVWRPPVAEEPEGAIVAPMARPEDPSGFLLLSIGPAGDRIVLEHYSNDAELLHYLSARTADELCRAALRCGAVSDLSHATYLGREAQKAELALRERLAYEQDRPIALSRT